MSASLDELLRHPALWRAGKSASSAAAVPTGFPALDACLPGGGWPASGLVEVLVEQAGTCELGLTLPALVELQKRFPEAWLTFVQPPHEPYAPALIAKGVDLTRFLVVRDTVDLRAASLWSMEQVLRSASCRCVLGWIMQPLRLRMTELRRLQLAATEVGALCFLFRAVAAAGIPSAANLRIAVEPCSDRLRIRLLKCRGRRAELELRCPDL